MAETAIPRRSGTWARRLPFLAFLFFLVKGLLWLLVPVALIVMQAAGGGIFG